MSQYDLEPIEYDMKPLEQHSTYDQFIQLRDTLVFSGKRYVGKAGAKLVIGEKEETIEVEMSNIFKMGFNSMTDLTPSIESRGPYVEYDTEVADIYGPISCVIKKDGRYRIIHKEEVLPTSSETKVICYVDIIRDGEYLVKGGVAVFYDEIDQTLSGTTSDGGTCSIRFTLGRLFQKITTFGYIERDLKAGDILVLRAMDEEPNPDGSPADEGYKLHLLSNSNFFSVEYIGFTL